MDGSEKKMIFSTACEVVPLPYLPKEARVFQASQVFPIFDFSFIFDKISKLTFLLTSCFYELFKNKEDKKIILWIQ